MNSSFLKALVLTAVILGGHFFNRAHAYDVSVIVHGVYTHHSRDGAYRNEYNNSYMKFNNHNLGLGLEVAGKLNENSNQWFGRLGSYKDSYSNQAVYANGGYRMLWGNTQGLHYGLTLQAGYLHGSGLHQIVVLPFAEVGYKNVDLEMLYAPEFDPKFASVTSFSLRYHF